jgi:hypothetical protein
MGRVLPEHGLPPTDYPPGAKLEWKGKDDLEGYRERGGHPVYGEHDVIYRFNKRGYRAPEFDARADVRVVAIGCSYVMGTGVAQEHLFHERFGAQLGAALSKSVVVWNLGWEGASNDYICRLLHFAVPELDPHVVLINFTHLARRDYVSVQNQHITYNPRSVPTNEIVKDIYGHFAALSSPYDDQLNFFKNYKTIELLLAGRCWLYSQIRPQETEAIAAHLDPRRYVGPFRTVDRARDGGHPGPESHEVLAGLFWDRLVELGDFEALARRGAQGDRGRPLLPRPPRPDPVSCPAA